MKSIGADRQDRQTDGADRQDRQTEGTDRRDRQTGQTDRRDRQTDGADRRGGQTGRADRPAVLLSEDVLDSLGQGEGLSGAVGPDEEHGGQGEGHGRGDGQDGLLLLGVQPGVQQLVPLPAEEEEEGILV